MPSLKTGALLLGLAGSVPAYAESSEVDPEGFVRMMVAAVISTESGPAVILRDETQRWLLPIMIGPSEAMSIQLRLDRKQFERPLSHDLLDTVVRKLGASFVKVHVDDLRGSTFVATLFLRSGDHTFEIDARPSDSIALAVGNRIPIYVARRVLDRTVVKPHNLEEPAKREQGDAIEQPRRTPGLQEL